MDFRMLLWEATIYMISYFGFNFDRKSTYYLPNAKIMNHCLFSKIRAVFLVKMNIFLKAQNQVLGNTVFVKQWQSALVLLGDRSAKNKKLLTFENGFVLPAIVYLVNVLNMKNIFLYRLKTLYLLFINRF